MNCTYCGQETPPHKLIVSAVSYHDEDSHRTKVLHFTPPACDECVSWLIEGAA